MTGQPLWAPWRIEYIRGPKPSGCIFCGARDARADRDSLVLFRGPRCFAMLNRYPYTAGHLMVVPNRHVAEPGALDGAESAELWSLLVRAQAALQEVFRPQGFNVGLNLGEAAGAGVRDHLHLHVVPRWVGDTNFMAATGDVSVISQHLADMYDSLAPVLAGAAAGGA